MSTSPRKQSARSSKPAPDSSSVAKRLQSELMQLMMTAAPGISAFPDSDNLLNWSATISGPAGTVYEGLKYRLSMKFPADYPYSSPTVRFETTCFHPNVDMNGNICLDILKEKWSPVYNVQSVLISLQSLLGEPNNDSPLNSEAAELWSKPEEFRLSVVKCHPGAGNE
ncbi:ubiquitin-conjugating enzyme X [Blyttiomyces helicus]|uniref:Ubiquitin-conjugating enzyme X n=1 Tax=Blyttiomyces helicus TaxID=388810 RepID=A0A4P9WAD3_9FUNG|nr:ubiquitin-conjugating enzyme X [Blyttiomyces helicus]|eukprot:RKO87196.1 ubiquitin-conjugating enzyme X [Blyttiomyces helicus]